MFVRLHAPNFNPPPSAFQGLPEAYRKLFRFIADETALSVLDRRPARIMTPDMVEACGLDAAAVESGLAFLVDLGLFQVEYISDTEEQGR